MALSALAFADSATPSGDSHPDKAGIAHLGAASCASSLCHGSVQPFEGSAILQNEFIIWQSDRYRNMHAKAYRKLETEAAKAMAQKLGIGPATEAPECLTCHADHVPKALRGERFQISDGVTCESCHGPAGDYIDAHVEGDLSDDQLVALGMYPTWEPKTRAQLCLSCHVGGTTNWSHGDYYGTRYINHRIMAAGHPRLSFELDTFTYLQPHHVVDEDYVERKGPVDFVGDWAMGQALASIQHLDWLTDRERGWRGIFVEPALLDCHSCHQRLDAGTWKARAATGLGPGEMRLNDANLVLLALVMIAVDEDAATQIREGTKALHQATTQGVEQVMTAATRLREQAENAVSPIDIHEFVIEDLRLILSEMTRQAESGALKDFIAAEQAAMAIVNLVLAFERGGVVEKDSSSDELDRMFSTVADPYDYSDREFAASIRALAKQLEAEPG